jgi:large subunit ribosomal protein L6
MSRVGKKPVLIPNDVTVTIEGEEVSVKGPKGTLQRQVNSLAKVEIEETEEGKAVVVSIEDQEDGQQKAQWGTARSVIANMVLGVTEGFSKKLEVNGVGYRVKMQGRTVVLSVGYSHDVPFDLPEGIDAVIEGNEITISGADKQLVGEVAANIRKVRKPEPYKGKGIKYDDEVIRRKAGKAQKTGE